MVLIVFAVIGVDDMIQSPQALHAGQHIGQHIAANIPPSAGKIIHARIPKIRAVFTAAQLHVLHVHHVMHLHVLHLKHLAHELRVAHPEI